MRGARTALSGYKTTSPRGQFADLGVAKSRLCCDAFARLANAVLRDFPISNARLN